MVWQEGVEPTKLSRRFYRSLTSAYGHAATHISFGLVRGSRTLNPSLAIVFETIVYTIPP